MGGMVGLKVTTGVAAGVAAVVAAGDATGVAAGVGKEKVPLVGEGVATGVATAGLLTDVGSGEGDTAVVVGKGVAIGVDGAGAGATGNPHCAREVGAVMAATNTSKHACLIVAMYFDSS